MISPVHTHHRTIEQWRACQECGGGSRPASFLRSLLLLSLAAASVFAGGVALGWLLVGVLR